MSIKAKLFLCKEERELLSTHLSYHRGIRFNGKPSTELMGGYLTVTFQSQMYDDSFLEWLYADRYNNDNIDYPYNMYKLQDGKIVFYKEEIDRLELFEYNFKDATLIGYKEIFDNQLGMQVTLTISPALQDYRFFNGMKWDERSPTRFIKYSWQESYIEPRNEKIIASNLNNTNTKENQLKIIKITGPYDVHTGVKLSKSISRFKDYYYEVEFNQPIENIYDVYWGQSLDNKKKINGLLNKSGRKLRGGSLFENGKKMRINLRFGLGENKFKIHVYLNDCYNEAISLELHYNKVIGIVKEYYKNENLSLIELYEVEESAFINEKTLFRNIQKDLGGQENDANQLFYDIKTPIGIMLDGIGGLGAGMDKAGGAFRITNGVSNGNKIKPKYYQSAWKGGSKAIITTYNMGKVGKVLGRAGAVGTVVIGIVDIGINYNKENNFGEKTQEATINAVGGLAGGYVGAEIGATIGGGFGAFFGGIGAVPGAVIGGIIGGITGGFFGGDALKKLGADKILNNTVNKFKD